MGVTFSGPRRRDLEAQLRHLEIAEQSRFAREQQLLSDLDARTRTPHLLVQIRSLGIVEICGKNHGGIFERLAAWLKSTWNLVEHTSDLRPDVYVPCNPFKSAQLQLQVRPVHAWGRLCDRSFAAGPTDVTGAVMGAQNFVRCKSNGESNLGKLTMELVHFMTNTCGWGLKLIDGCTLGRQGQLREMQIKFTAPHPLNLLAPHLLIDLRQSGYIEVFGPNTKNIYDELHHWLVKNWHAQAVPADPNFCDRKYKCTAFKKRGSEGENNMGLCAMKLVDFLNKGCHWKMIACNASNFGRLGDQREQQIAVRFDDFKHQDRTHVLVELRDVGYIEVSGLEASSQAAQAVHQFITHQWRCTEYKNNIFETFNSKYCDRKYRTPGDFYQRQGLQNTLGRRTIELATFMSSQGWDLAACNGGSLILPKRKKKNGDGVIRENQIKFVSASGRGLAESRLLLVEFRSVPGADAQGRAFLQSFIEITGFDTNGIYGKLTSFVQNHMQSQLVSQATPFCDLCFACDAFQMKEAALKCKEGRFLGESNFGKYAMRLCDFMVDYLGEWDLLVCNNNCLNVPLKGQASLAREAQMVFRFRDSSRDVFLSSTQAPMLGHAPFRAPNYWTMQGKAGEVAQEVLPASPEEVAMLQEVMDGTYKAKATRDRMGAAVPRRLVVVAALRSETPALWERYARRRDTLEQELKGDQELITPLTLHASLGLTLRCIHQDRGNGSNEAYLLHGSNPTSAMSILGTSFNMDLAGKNAGSMFGPGIYMAESSVKADEYARDDTSGSYAGLFAVLFCRALVGRALQVTDPADYGPLVTGGEFHSVVGDRQKAVGTFREFVFFHEESIYPEFAVFYRREM